MSENIKVIILCGGMGTRLKEETEYRPKPLVEIGGKPILWHIMKTYSYYGFNDFVLCLGYKGDLIKKYFLNYEFMNTDFTIELGKRGNIQKYDEHMEKNWTVTMVNTGIKAQTGARIKRVGKFVEDPVFMLTYGDGVSNINIKDLLEFHKSHGKIGTVSGVRPSSRFGELIVEDKMVKKFNEKPRISDGLINGGFFVFNRAFFDYLKDDDGCYLEREPLEKLADDGELGVYVHSDFWQCVDTYRELEYLNRLWDRNEAAWKVW